MGTKVWFKLVEMSDTRRRIPFAGVTLASVLSDGVNDIDDLRKKIRSKYRFEKVDILEHALADQLVVYANKAAYDAKQPLNPYLQWTGQGENGLCPVIVEVPQLPQQPQLQLAQQVVNWSDPVLCPQLVVQDKDLFIQVPAGMIDGAGIGSSDRPLILYRRPPLLQQWNEMNRCSIQTYALLWVVGPPGTGKSCAALTFAMSLDRSKWDVIWIHYERNREHFNCVWLQGSEKRVCVVKKEAMEMNLNAILDSTSTKNKTILFLDGYVKSSLEGEAARLKCKRWQQKDEFNHRLVCVCSMVSIGKNYRVEDYPRIPANVESKEQLEDVNMTPSELHDDRDNASIATQAGVRAVKAQMLFQLESWIFEDYERAIEHDKFFSCVVNMFPPYPRQADAEKEFLERVRLIREKYFVVGGSARLMFDFSTDEAIESLDDAIDQTPNIEKYLEGSVGDSSDGAVNRLLARYYNANGRDIRLVSDYVVRKFATQLGPRLLQKFARACAVNPSMDGFILEAWFFAELRHNGLSWSFYLGSLLQRRQWEKSCIYFFDPSPVSIKICLDNPTWLAPMKWNQGGYDAVYVDKTKGLVRFVQVTRAEKHDFQEIAFVMLLNKLANQLNQITEVEVYFVLPLERLNTFKLPVSEENLMGKVVKVACSEQRASRSRPDPTFQNCIARVLAIGVDYKLTEHHPVEGSYAG